MRLLILPLLLSAVWPAFGLAQDPVILPGHSAHWYNPDRSGEGWVLEILDGDRANLYWFTYDEEGNQRWLTGVGDVDGGAIVFPEMIVTRGGRFGPGFDPEEVEREVGGELVFRFDDCASGEVEYAVFGQAGVVPVQRLTRTMAVECPPLDGRPVRSAGALSGSWYEPAHSGEGFALQWLDRGEAVVTWFTYDPEGNQFWMIGLGQTDGDARLVVSELVATRGARFGEAFDPDDVERFDWGELAIELDCAGGPAQYDSVLPGFGSGSQQLSRLTALAGLACPLFMPALGEIADARWDQRFHTAGLSHSFFNPPQAYDFAPAGDGRMLVAGDFAWFGRTMVPPLLLGDAASGEWQPLAALEIDALSVTALANDPEHGLALATQERGFSPLGQPLAGEIVLVEAEGQRSIGRFDGAVRRLAWHRGRLWAAGWFEWENGGPAHLAVWDGNDWQPPPGGEPDAPVYALAPDGDGLLVGGEFQSVGGIAARGVARVEGQSWTAFDLPARVLAVERIGGVLYAAGSILSITAADGASGGVVRWNGASWEVVGEGLSNRTFPGVVSDIQAFRGAVYALGCFVSANGPPGPPGSEPALGLARWTGSRWESLDPGLRRSPAFFLQDLVCGSEGNPSVIWLTERQRLASDGEHLYVGGAFPGIDGADSHSLITFDGENFKAQGEAGLGRSGGYFSGLAVGGPDDAVYGFARVFDNPAPMSIHAARFDQAAGWQAFGPPLPGNETCSVIENGLAVDPAEEVFVGCRDFSGDPAGLRPRTRVLRMDGDQWVDVSGTAELGPLAAMALDPAGVLWIAGGILDGPLGTGEGYVARLAGGAVEIVEDGFDGPVRQLSFDPAPAADSPRELVAGGVFTRVAGREVNFIARFDGEDWNALVDGLPDVPTAIEFGRDRIFASANPSGAEGLALGAFDGERWTELATGERNFPPVAGTPWFGDIRQVGERLFLAGNVVPAIEDWPDYGPRLYIFENGRFESLGGGVVGFVDRLEARHDAVWILGSLIEADPAGQPVSTLGLGRLAWP